MYLKQSCTSTPSERQIRAETLTELVLQREHVLSRMADEGTELCGVLTR